MGMNNYLAQGLLDLLFKNTTLAAIGDATGLVGSTGVGSLYASLHTGDPGVSGDQTTNEIAYTSYTRVAVARTSGGWSRTGDVVSPASTISFPAGTGGSGTATYLGIGTALTTAGHLLLSGAISPSIVTGNGITPQITTSTTITFS